MNYFPNNTEELNLIKFIAKYQYLRVRDAEYFFSSKKYYKKRVAKLIEEKYFKKLKWNIALDNIGIECAKMLHCDYTRASPKVSYIPRLLFVSHLGAFYNNCPSVQFIPSVDIKPKEQLTIKSRKYLRSIRNKWF